MPRYFIQIQQDSRSSDLEALEFADAAAALEEAGAVCAGLMRGIIVASPGRAEWRLDVTDEAGELPFGFSFVAEVLD